MQASSQEFYDSDRALQKAQGVASVFMAFLALMFILGGSKVKNPVIGTTSIVVGLSLAGTSLRRSFRHDVTANDAIEGLTDLLVDDVAEAFKFSGKEGHRLTQQFDPIIISKLPDRVKAALPVEVEDQAWFDDEGFWLDSKYIAGAKGSGKSFMLAREIYMTLKAHPDAKLLIIDPHLSDGSDWFGGDEKMIDRYCIRLSRKDFDRAITAIDEFCKEFEDRVEQGDKNRVFAKLIVDEWEAAIKILTNIPCTNAGAGINNYAAKLLDLDERIQDEGRKFQVELTNGLHTFKKGRSGQDSDTVIQKHWLVCGDALSQPNIKLPDNIPVAQLEADRLRIERQLVPTHFAKTGIIRANTTPRTKGFMKAVGFPWFDPSEFEFQVLEQEEPQDSIPEVDREAEWIQSHKEEVEALYLSGVTTLRKISDKLKVRRSNENWEYLALKKCVEQITTEQQQIIEALES